MSSVLEKAGNNRDLPKAFLTSLASGWRQRRLFQQVETYCMFIGYGRSGHSLVGSLLDAHPEAAIAHELDALRYLRTGFGRDQLYALILDKQRRDAESGRWSGVYQYAVPGQWQGRFERLRVIGDKKGGKSTSQIIVQPGLLDKLRRTVGVPLRFVHVTRNPYDNIATMLGKKKRNKTLPATMDFYFSLCQGVADHRRTVATDEIVDLRHEDLPADPTSFLRRLCEFVGLNAREDYIEDCARILYSSPKKTRTSAPWTAQLVEDVAERMQRFRFLDGYTFES